MLIDVKMPTIVGILTFMSSILCSAELSMEKRFITSGPGLTVELTLISLTSIEISLGNISSLS